MILAANDASGRNSGAASGKGAEAGSAEKRKHNRGFNGLFTHTVYDDLPKHEFERSLDLLGYLGLSILCLLLTGSRSGLLGLGVWAMLLLTATLLSANSLLGRKMGAMFRI